jgi:hypothetical protein
MSRTLAVALLLGLLGAALPALAQDEEAEEPPTEPSCYDRARQSTQLSDDQALRLCGAAVGEAPAACFERATQRTDLSTDDAVTLCQCSGPAAVACYERGINTSMLSSDALRMCARTYSSLFPPVCLGR